MDLFSLICGVGAGALVVWFLLRSSAKLQHAALTERLATRELQLEEMKRELGAKSERVIVLERSATELRTRFEETQRAITEERALLEKAKGGLSDVFKALSSEALAVNNQQFLNLAKTLLEKYQQGAQTDLESRQKAIEQLVKPIGDSLTQVTTKIDEIEKQRHTSFGSISEQLKAIASSEAQLRTETANLVKALRTPHVRGAWGELQLRRAVEFAGMLEHCDFIEQEGVSTADGRLRPDMLVNLPGKRRIIIDAKAPLQAYLEALEHQDETVRTVKLREHAQQVKRHVQSLSSKAYWEQFDNTPELVVMFLPGDAFLSAAFEHEPRLLEFGIEQRVFIATPLTLIAMLRAVAYGWRQEQVAENAQKISALGRDLHDRIRTFADRLLDLRKGLEKAVDSFNLAANSFNSRILPSTRRFQELGASSGKELPDLEVIDAPARSIERETLGVETAPLAAEAPLAEKQP